MLKLRLTRTGKRNDPRFRVVVAEHSRPVKGKFVAIVGHYDPIHKDLVIKKDEIKKWLDNGAKPSNRVAILLKKEGMKHPSIVVQKFNKKPKGKKGDKGTEEPKTDAKPASDGKTEDAKEKTAEKNEEKKDSAEPNNEDKGSEEKKEEKTEEKK